MDPSCSRNACDVFDGTNRVPYDTNENKTETNANMADKGTSTTPVRRRIDDLEREDFDEENRLLNHCSIVDGKITTSHYSGNLSIANSSLASSSEAISSFSNLISNGYSLPGCSKECDDSNTTIKNMISRKYIEEPRAVEIEKPDFMKKLLSSGVKEKKDYSKGKLYKADRDCDNDITEGCDLDIHGPSARTSSNASSIGSSGSDSTKDFTVPSTSNAEKLLGLDDSSKRNEAGSSKSSVSNYYFAGLCFVKG